MNIQQINAMDQELVAAAGRVLEQNYNNERHSIGAAVLCSSGKIYTAVNVESCGYGPCAEPIAIGSAISAGERSFETIVAVGNAQPPHKIVSPCGNCRQLLFDYAPDCLVIIEHESRVVKIPARDLIPDAYSLF